ncbi:MAG: fluoride efflux transporter CrcB [Nitrospirae bacterium]|nr:fluoride efflux transporter CrcB [Nitrospirota bacterium]
MRVVLYIIIFGALGCVSRYYLSGWVYHILGRNFPYGTFAVNIVSAFIIGLVMEYGILTEVISFDLRVGITVGFLGGLSTLSALSYETFRLLQDGKIFLAIINGTANFVACILFTWFGVLAARQLI